MDFITISVVIALIKSVSLVKKSAKIRMSRSVSESMNLTSVFRFLFNVLITLSALSSRSCRSVLPNSPSSLALRFMILHFHIEFQKPRPTLAGTAEQGCELHPCWITTRLNGLCKIRTCQDSPRFIDAFAIHRVANPKRGTLSARHACLLVRRRSGFASIHEVDHCEIFLSAYVASEQVASYTPRRPLDLRYSCRDSRTRRLEA
jgi:hypothetical protein